MKIISSREDMLGSYIGEIREMRNVSINVYKDKYLQDIEHLRKRLQEEFSLTIDEPEWLVDLPTDFHGYLFGWRAKVILPVD